MLDALVFYSLAAIIIGFGVRVVTARSPVDCLGFLVAVLLGVAMVDVLLAAPFLALMQILVFAIGIVALYLLVVVLISPTNTADAEPPRGRHTRFGFALVACLLAEIVAVFVYSASHGAPLAALASQSQTGGRTQTVGRLLATDYLVPVAMAALLLLAATVGAVVLARRNPRSV